LLDAAGAAHSCTYLLAVQHVRASDQGHGSASSGADSALIKKFRETLPVNLHGETSVRRSSGAAMLRCARRLLSLACYAGSPFYARHRSRAPLPRPRSQWGRVEDEATESMTPHKPAALSTQSGLLSPRQRGARTPLLLVAALCVMQTLLLAVLGGGLTGARWTLERLDAALEGARRSLVLFMSRPSTSCRQLRNAASEEQDARSCGRRSTARPLGIKLLRHSVPGNFHAKALRKLVCLNLSA